MADAAAAAEEGDPCVCGIVPGGTPYTLVSAGLSDRTAVKKRKCGGHSGASAVTTDAAAAAPAAGVAAGAVVGEPPVRAGCTVAMCGVVDVDPSATMCRSLMRAGAFRCVSVRTDSVQGGTVVKTVLMRDWEDARMKVNKPWNYLFCSVSDDEYFYCDGCSMQPHEVRGVRCAHLPALTHCGRGATVTRGSGGTGGTRRRASVESAASICPWCSLVWVNTKTATTKTASNPSAQTATHRPLWRCMTATRRRSRLSLPMQFVLQLPTKNAARVELSASSTDRGSVGAARSRANAKDPNTIQQPAVDGTGVTVAT